MEAKVEVKFLLFAGGFGFRFLWHGLSFDAVHFLLEFRGCSGAISGALVLGFVLVFRE